MWRVAAARLAAEFTPPHHFIQEQSHPFHTIRSLAPGFDNFLFRYYISIVMLDPITALGIAGNVVQFIDFGIKATSKTREIRKNAKRMTVADADLEFVTKDLVALNAQLYASVGSSSEAEALEELCGRCAKTAGELLSALQTFTVQGKKTKWKSTRKALKSLWGRDGVEEMKQRLLDFREELKLISSLDFGTHAILPLVLAANFIVMDSI